VYRVAVNYGPASAADHASWQVGDIVTRDGTDEHEMVANVDGQVMEFRCVKAPEDGWAKVGETETDMADRYNFVRRPASDAKRFALRFKMGVESIPLDMERITASEIRVGDIVQICEPDGTPVADGFGRVIEPREEIAGGIQMEAIAEIRHRDLRATPIG